MLKTIIAALVGAAALPAIAAAPAPIEVMVLGAYHFDNPGRDLNNVKVASVLTVKRQAELAAVAKAVLAWHPTRVMVEYESDAPDLSVPAYASFTPADLATKPDERVQIAYRIAHLAGVPVNGIDEQNKADEPDYFPYDKVQEVAAKTGQTARLTSAMAPIAAWSKAFEASQSTRTVAQLLTEMNDPTEPVANNSPTYAVLDVGDHDRQPGADLAAMWYLRNAKIFGKLMQVARPGDRVLVVYGGGHGYWLRHFASETPGYRSVDVRPYLAKVR
ncbi:hypothetical protein KX816_11160 [Sphingosinicellaceae bacterium]|nr:hypothetical protein KX816_11160 [Sphingosinicellaceae bacterium]